MSSQFSSPFLIKSPLKAYVSTAGHFARMQDKISSATISALGPKTSKCEQGAEYYFDKDGAKFVCPKKPSVKDTGLSVEDTKKALKRIGATTTGDKNDPFNLQAKMKKNTGLTDKQSIEERVEPGLSSRFNVGNTYQ
jgi:hypothetical protein|tara:strand:- start:25 stop:435 length:411 start_codon:yes stop_codon:yes gene_type:complete